MTLNYQWTRDHRPPYVQIGERAQTKNECSLYSFDAVTACVNAQNELRAKGYDGVSFIGSCNDGVSSDKSFVIDTLSNFVDVNISYTAHTKCNHNIKICVINVYLVGML